MAVRLIMAIADAVRRHQQRQRGQEEDELPAADEAVGEAAGELKELLPPDISAALMASADWPQLAQQLVALRRAGVDLGDFLPRIGEIAVTVRDAGRGERRAGGHARARRSGRSCCARRCRRDRCARRFCRPRRGRRWRRRWRGWTRAASTCGRSSRPRTTKVLGCRPGGERGAAGPGQSRPRAGTRSCRTGR